MESLEQVFNNIVKDYSERLYWHVRRMVNSHEDADDLLQEIFLKIWTALPEKQRQVFVMRWWDELSYEQISAITGTSVGALKASYHIAQEKLKLNLSTLDVSK